MGSLSIKQVGKTFDGTVRVLEDINIEVGDGEFLVLVGPSGCGKSTLLNMIAGLEDITEGTIEIDDKVVNDLAPADRDIAMVFQSYALYPTMTVAGNISFGLEMRGVRRAERRKAVERVAELLEIGHLLGRKPSQLSGGQRQRVAMGRALVRDPKVFLFDEPLSNLDAKLRVQMRSEIKRIHKRTGTTFVYVTHDQIEAMTMATQICVLESGIIQQQGTPYEIYSNPTNVFVAGFMGSPPMNLIPAALGKGADGGWELAVTRENEQPLKLTCGLRVDPALNGRRVILGIRPEHIVEEQPRETDEGLFVAADCILDLIEPTGADTLGVLQLGERETVSRLRPNTSASLTEPTRLYFNMAHACLFDVDSGERVDGPTVA